MEFLNDYIAVIALVAALCVGYVVRNVITNEQVNRFIPAICALTGVVVLLWDANWVATPQLVVAGMMSGIAASGLYDQFKMIIEKKDESAKA